MTSDHGDCNLNNNRHVHVECVRTNGAFDLPSPPPRGGIVFGNSFEPPMMFALFIVHVVKQG